MTNTQRARKPRTLIWGSGVLVVLAVFLGVNAGWLYATAADEALFEQDVGARRSEVEAAFPGVPAGMTSIVRISAVLMLGLALAVGGATLRGLRTSATARVLPSDAPWAAAFALLGIGALFLTQERVGLAVFHLVFGALFAVGQVLVMGGRWTVGLSRAPLDRREL